MSFSQIKQEDLADKGVVGLPDTPNLNATEMQRKLDELALDVIIPKFNTLVDELHAKTASESIGVTPPADFEGETLKALLDVMAKMLKACDDVKHSHNNKATLDKVTSEIFASVVSIISLLTGITKVSNTVSNSAEEIPTGKAIFDYVLKMGGGDMAKATYDTDNDGVVDDAAKLGGELPEYYETDILGTSEEVEANTQSEKLVDSLVYKADMAVRPVIVFATEEPTEVPVNTIIAVYEE